MKKIFLTLAAAVVLSTSVFAQDDNGRQQRRQMDPKEMVQKRTEQTAKQYNLDEAQTAKLLELNTKYSETMFRGMRMRGGQNMGQGQRPQRQGQMGGQRRQMTDEQRAEMQKRREEMQKQMEAYNTELKSIMTEEQYKKYQEDMQKRQQRGNNRRQR
ncbi:MAG: DUF4890 domain-containing protein [Prevotella sp.]|nr:DUF4890 domain-containing protein [Prevotella sp.]